MLSFILVFVLLFLWVLCVGCGVGPVQMEILRLLGESLGLNVGDLSRLLGVSRCRVYDAVRGLEAKGLVESFAFHIQYYSKKGVKPMLTRIYKLTEAGKALLGLPSDYKPARPLESRTFISYEEFRNWGSQPSSFYRACKDAWAEFKALRESQRKKLQV